MTKAALRIGSCLVAAALGCALGCVLGCAKGGEYHARNHDRPHLMERVSHRWTLPLGGPSHARGTALGIAPGTALNSNARGLLLGGSFDGVMHLGSAGHSLQAVAGSDGFVARLHDNGEVQWLRRLGGAGAEQVTAVAPMNAGRAAVALSVFEDAPLDPDDIDMDIAHSAGVRGMPGALIVMLDDTGRPVSAMPVHSDQRLHVTAMAVAGPDEAPALIVVGWFHGTMRVGDQVFTSAGANDMFVFCLDTDNNNNTSADNNNSAGNSAFRLRWAKRAGGPGPDVAMDVAARGDRLVMVGAISERSRIGDLDVAVVPSAGRVRRPGQDAFMASADVRTGRIEWLKTLGGTGPDQALAVALTAEGTAYTAGTFIGSAYVKLRRLDGPGQDDDVFIMALDVGGGVIWSTTLGGPGRDHALAIAATTDGVVVAGTFERDMVVGSRPLTSAGAHDIFAVKLSVQGDIAWARRFGGESHDAVADLVADHDTVFVTGSFSGRADLGADTPTSAPGDTSGFVMRLR